MTSIFSVSREDLYDYRRCPKIVAIKAYKALRAIRAETTKQARVVEPAIVGMIGEAATKLAFANVPLPAAMQRIAKGIPQVDLNDFLKQIAFESLKGAEKIRDRLSEKYGSLRIIGRGEGRHPDLAGTARPDFIAFAGQSTEPIIVETKDSARKSPADDFQAMFYNGIADKFGVYVLEERIEGDDAIVAPRQIRSRAETVIVYPRLSEFSIVKDNFVPDMEAIREVWKAKELGFQGHTPETECGSKCAHQRLKINLPEENMDSLPPLPLIFSAGILEENYDLDTIYQVNYAWKLLPLTAKTVIARSYRSQVRDSDAWKNWLLSVVGLEAEAAEIILHFERFLEFLQSKPKAEVLLKSMERELEPWEKILKNRLKIAAPSILGRATAVYSLPRRSSEFITDAWRRWQ